MSIPSIPSSVTHRTGFRVSFDFRLPPVLGRQSWGTDDVKDVVKIKKMVRTLPKMSVHDDLGFINLRRMMSSLFDTLGDPSCVDRI